jgi:putative hydrolase of the HAD superfamily
VINGNRVLAPKTVATLRPPLRGSGGPDARTEMTSDSIAAVVFDLGGVVMESPLHALARFEQDCGIERNAINRAIVAAGDQGAWARLERGELSLEEFCTPFEADCRSCGLEVSGVRMMAYIAEASVLRPRMLEAIRRIRDHGRRTAALTNNWRSDRPRGPNPLAGYFDVIIESAVVGLRKPDPRIYELVCRELGVAPSQTVFLDDIGRNLKAARALGMKTIKVDDPDEALRELGALLGIDLIA